MRRWIGSDGLVGSPPEWYPLIRAARYLCVPPWELARQPSYWRDVALMAEQAEIGGENDRTERLTAQGAASEIDQPAYG